MRLSLFSSVAVVIVASSVVGGTFVDRLHSSVEVASHTVAGCCEVDVVWSSCDTFVEVNVMRESPVVCGEGLRRMLWGRRMLGIRG